VVHNIAEDRVPGPGNEEDNEGNDLLGKERDHRSMASSQRLGLPGHWKAAFVGNYSHLN
jgi:hypothetical protein